MCVWILRLELHHYLLVHMSVACCTGLDARPTGGVEIGSFGADLFSFGLYVYYIFKILNRGAYRQSEWTVNSKPKLLFP